MKKTLFILCALLLTAVGASAESSWTAPGSTLESGGKYYLYNTEAKQYACEGSYKWGTNAIFGDEGLLFTLASVSTADYDGTTVTAYTLTSSAGQFFWDGEYIYCDGSSKTTGIYFVFTETSTGSKVYKIHGTYAAMNTYIGYDPEDVSASYGTHAVLPALTGTTGQGIEWELVDESTGIDLHKALVILYNTLVHAESYGMTDQDAAYKAAGEVYLTSTATVNDVMEAVAALEIAMEAYASDTDPDDVTYAYITNPSFDTGDLTGWSDTFDYHADPHTNGEITISGYAETWVASGSYLANKAFSQTLTLPKGTYRLEADVVATQENNSSLQVSGVYLCAGSQMTSVHTSPGLPEHYSVEFYVTNENGESADIGIKIHGTDANWVAVDNFVLYYLGEEVTAVTDTESEYKKGDVIEIDGSTYYVQCDNMVKNHSFELGFDGWTNAKDHTTITFTNFDLRSDGAKDGQAYLVGTTNDGASGAGSLGTAWSIESGKTYYFSYYIKNLDGTEETEYLKTSLTSTMGTESSVLGYPSSVSSDWQKVEYSFTNTSNYAYVQIEFRWLDSHWGFDNFQLYEIDEELLPIDWEMTDAGWGTLILPFDVETVPEGLTLYAGDALTLDGTTITVDDASETIAANTPYLVNGTAGTYSFTGAPTNTADSYTSGLLTGTLVDMTYEDFTANSGQYVLQNHDDEGLAFYLITDESTGVTLNAYHCYLTSSAGQSGARAFISLPDSDDTATAIEAVESDVIANDAIYDLSGRKVSKAVKGVYIQNGKKVLVK